MSYTHKTVEFANGPFRGKKYDAINQLDSFKMVLRTYGGNSSVMLSFVKRDGFAYLDDVEGLRENPGDYAPREAVAA